MGRKKTKRRAEAATKAKRSTEAELDEVRRRAEADDRTVSAWIRRAVEAELGRIADGDA